MKCTLLHPCDICFTRVSHRWIMVSVQGSDTNGDNSASSGDTASATGTSHDKDEYILYDSTIK